MDNMTGIELKGVGLTYPSSSLGIKSKLLNREVVATKVRHSLADIDLLISPGDSIGLIGLNGAGKTTLLRILAGIIPPTAGTRIANGKIGTLLGDGIGFELEMSGWNNIESRLIVYGATKREAKQLRASVVEFADIGEAIHRPMKTYSAGMIVRVGFAVSTALKPDVLLVDEVIGAGDITFEQKSRERMHSYLKDASILVLATHNLEIMLNFCNKVVWLEAGRIRQIGNSLDVIAKYQREYLQ
jgi:ABC-type polysaccharide/polyol phosphate transport system ATPase subunit